MSNQIIYGEINTPDLRTVCVIHTTVTGGGGQDCQATHYNMNEKQHS